VASYKIRASRGLPLVARIALVDLVTAGTGILVALLALMNDEYIGGLRVIDPESVAILIGLGLGIGSLKEIVDK